MKIGGAAQGGAGGLGDEVQHLGGLTSEIEELLVDDTSNAVAGPQELVNVFAFVRFLDDTVQGLVDYRGRPPRLSNYGIASEACSHEYTSSCSQNSSG